jgi:4-hydroxybenzoate polyprenyltransferase
MFFNSLKVYYRVCRLESWTSWIFSFVLGSILLSLPSLERFITVSLAFMLATAFIFVINQYFDREADKHNDIKRRLPLASGSLSPRGSILFSALLVSSSLVLVLLTDMLLLPPLIFYLGLGIAYSAPIPNLKTVPIADFIVSAVGAGFLPFYIGLATARRSAVDIPLMLFISVPLMAFHSGGHLVQTLGDYSADRDFGLNTFPVRYGQKKAAFLVAFFFFLAFLSPFVYLFLGLIQPVHFVIAVILIPLFPSILMRFIELYKQPSEEHAVNLQKTVKKTGIFGLVIILAYVLAVRFL